MFIDNRQLYKVLLLVLEHTVSSLDYMWFINMMCVCAIFKLEILMFTLIYIFQSLPLGDRF